MLNSLETYKIGWLIKQQNNEKFVSNVTNSLMIGSKQLVTLKNSHIITVIFKKAKYL